MSPFCVSYVKPSDAGAPHEFVRTIDLPFSALLWFLTVQGGRTSLKLDREAGVVRSHLIRGTLGGVLQS